MIFENHRLIDKSSEEMDALFENHSSDIEAKINCLDCGQCCRTISPIILPEEIPQISKALAIAPAILFRDYVEMDEEGDFVFKIQPCPMLNIEDNRCMIYDDRPQACREYPHTRMKNITAYWNILEKNYEICPIVQEVVNRIEEELKNE